MVEGHLIAHGHTPASVAALSPRALTAVWYALATRHANAEQRAEIDAALRPPPPPSAMTPADRHRALHALLRSPGEGGPDAR